MQKISYPKRGFEVRITMGEREKTIREVEALVSQTNRASFILA